MQVSRLKILLYLIGLSPLLWLAWHQSVKVFDSLTINTNKVIVSGAINYAASLGGLVMLLTLFLLGGIAFFSGKSLRWLPKIIFIILGGGVAISSIVGFKINHIVIDKLGSMKYVECIDEREISLKYSSRTYVLRPSMCE